ncbi:hypothetical protein [Sphingomonas sanguinis]|uniref:Uncharacterized protein n=1 Tax=Sphingomonas sanguinis TaxID=33051 RepID=A0A147IKM4_9SPHN|nr:hypothetical protein [Sphingomonas sanguinis]KTT95772.1 hypothetical protein SB4_16935 [Sphingomonas sanguinis]
MTLPVRFDPNSRRTGASVWDGLQDQPLRRLREAFHVIADMLTLKACSTRIRGYVRVATPQDVTRKAAFVANGRSSLM